MVNIVERYGNEIKQLSPEERLELATLILNSLKEEVTAPLPRPAKRPIGLAEGLFVVPADFNDPLIEELLDALEDTIALDAAYFAIDEGRVHPFDPESARKKAKALLQAEL
ncbi:hypothetical protein [Armatimonas rosea]|uniref:Uncharacterized protein n=1 Tax=Armatimonas rosea TaxID=685828 RepID=A0A7W9STY3_ARMRO|nr:hypothetical protein [Armatimonas rosea]MBB6051914.1 hypothetical protein [Armatimonas rosea]